MDTICGADLVAALRSPDAYRHDVESEVIVHETHISWVFLAGQYAYKVKKPVTTNFLNYATLAQRQRYCQEEIRLDRRYAAELYLGVVPITLEGGKARMEGKGEPVEYAVKMIRFPDDALLSDRLDKGKLSTAEVLQLAGAVARFHREAAKADPNLPWGSPQFVFKTAQDNLQHLQSSPAALDSDVTLSVLDQWTNEFFDQHQLMFSQRAVSGFIRECHGDLHLANVIHWHGQLMPFDGIEFNDEFRWIDVLSDASFLAMDFAARDHLDLCRSFINAYLELSGDHESLPLLRWYLVFRALVRAKVASMRAQQQSEQPACDPSAAVADCCNHIQLAHRFTIRHQPCLWITHGLSGSGKTTGSELVVQRRGAIRLRSDIERKRHFGLPLDHSSDRQTRGTLYSESATAATYGRLRGLAERMLRAGYSVVVDATFIKHHQRSRFRELAEKQGAGFAILNFHADEQTLRQRIAERMAKNDDASDADVQVLELQLKSREPLTASEMQDVVEIPDAVSAIHAL